jgi:hypothetical protein
MTISKLISSHSRKTTANAKVQVVAALKAKRKNLAPSLRPMPKRNRRELNARPKETLCILEVAVFANSAKWNTHSTSRCS